MCMCVYEYVYIYDIYIYVPPLTCFDFVQFDQKVGQYHLTGTDIVITKSDFL